MKMNSKMESNLTAMWVSFFTSAGIPSDVSATYSLTFTENRIQTDMLLDLNKEYLRDMGITRMGDVIAILRHAKQVHENAARDKVLNTAAATSVKVPVAAVTGRSTVSQPSSPASRILEHYTRNPQLRPESPSGAPHAIKRKPIEAGSDTMDLGIKKARMIRFTTPPEPTIKEGPSNKTVFARLGNNEPPKLVSTKAAVKPIYARLGSKAVTRSDDINLIPMDKNALKYEGILKSPPSNTKKIQVTTSKNVRKISCTMRADETPVSVKEKLALPKAAPKSLAVTKAAPKSVKFSKHIQYKEIEPISKPPLKYTPVFNKPERRLSMPENVGSNNVSNNGIKSRLGSKNVNNLTITRNVFNRLGV